MQSALRDLLAAENRLRWLMGITPTDGALIRPIDRPTMARIEFPWQDIHTESLVRSAELRRQRWQVKQRETEMIAARNQLLPQLDLVATYRWLGMGDDLIVANRRGLNFINTDPADGSKPINPNPGLPVGAPTPGSVAFDELTEGRFQEAQFGLQFTPPRIGARRELSGVRNAQLALVREKARLEDMELNVSHLLTTAIQNLDFNYQTAQTHFNRWVAAEKEVEALKALYEGGQATVDLVLDGQKRKAQAQADFYRAIVEYNKAIANVHFRKGSLLEYDNVTLAEGPWPKKAYWDALGQARKRDASYYLDYGWTRPHVISRGPVDQTGESSMPIEPMIENQEIPLEQIPAPAMTPDEFPLDSPTEAIPDRNAMLDGPSLSLRDDAPAELLEAPTPNQVSAGLLGSPNLLKSAAQGVRQVSHQSAPAQQRTSAVR